MARKTKKTTAKTPARKTVKNELPKGYESIGGFGKSWPNGDTAIGEMLVGTLADYDEFEAGKGKDKRTVQTVKLETAEGVFTLYNSSGLAALFEYDEGTKAAVIFDGYGKASPGRNPPKLFRVGVK